MIRFIKNRLHSFFSKNRKKEVFSEELMENRKKTVIPETPDHVPAPSQHARKAPPKKPISGKKKPPWNISQFVVPEIEEKIRFHDIQLPSKIMHGICDLKFQYSTPIQAEILPKALKGLDVTGRAQTGTGKSAAFLITIYTLFLRNPLKGKRRPGTPRALILAPTRELAIQIKKDAQAIGKYTRSKTIAIFGGMDYEKQRKALKEKIFDIVVATPGRLLDFEQQKVVDLSKIEILIIDEADRMLDMGFIPDMRKIIRKTPKKDLRQTMFFSATLTSEVNRLAKNWTKEPYSVEIEPEKIAAEAIQQRVYIVTSDEKFSLLYNLITQKNLSCVLVFSNTREETRNLAKRLEAYNINSALLSGEVAQKKRLRTLENFKKGNIKVLVATDVAARGIHVDGISHVVNYNLPQDPEDYVHRIGRTGRAGATGISVSFASEDDSFYIPAIEKLLGHDLACEYPGDELLKSLPPRPPQKQKTDRKNKYHSKNKPKKQPYHQKNRRKSSKSGSYKPRKNLSGQNKE